MPPKTKVTKEDIIKTALALCRGNGKEAVNARAIAAVLGCSTQPIFSNFTTMEELQGVTLAAAHACYLAFLEREAASGKHPAYKAYGMAYIRFAREEKELFRLLFMCDRKGSDLPSTKDFDASVAYIMEQNALSRERATLMHLEMWCAVHGIATMVATSFLELDEEVISRITSDIYQGVRNKHISEERENGSH